MQDKTRRYFTLVICQCICAAVVIMLALRTASSYALPWRGMIHFIFLASLFELLTVNIREGECTSVSPTGPIWWAAICVLGPFPGLLVSIISGSVALTIRCGCHHLGIALQGGNHQATTNSALQNFWSKLRQHVARAAASIGSSWQIRSLGVTVTLVASFLSGVILETGGAGLVYHWLGGEALIASGRDSDQGWRFLLPFLGLVSAAGCINAAIYALATAAIDPIPGAAGLYGTFLRARLALVSTAWPIVRGQLFLSVVAFLLAYLYSKIGVVGFILAITPVLALRDFFHQWVEEKEAYLNTITTLATYMQHYHPYTRGHLQRVADLSERLARELRLPIESIRHMKAAGLLHDIGKVGVSEEILDKPGELNDEEWVKIKEHPIKGAEIVSHLEFLEGIVDWIKYHHKWYNGSGYPVTNGNGAEPPIEAAIIATADAFDAMTDDREMSPEWKCDSCGFKIEGEERPNFCPKCGAEKRRRYRQPKTIDEAIDEIRRGAGTQFHPRVVKAFLTMIERDGARPNA